MSQALRHRRWHAAVAAILGASALVLVPLTSAGTSSTLEILYQSTALPGDVIWINGASWFPPTNCPNHAVATLTDALGHSFNVGTVKFDQYETDSNLRLVGALYGSVTIPLQAAAGHAKIKVEQKLEFKLPVVGCFALAKKQSSVDLTIQGAIGDNPPVLSALHVPASIVQRTSAQIMWRLSKAATVSVTAGYRFNGDKTFWLTIGTVAAAAGPGSLTWDATYNGHAVPVGRWLIRVAAADAANAQANPLSGGFEVRGG